MDEIVNITIINHPDLPFFMEVSVATRVVLNVHSGQYM
jgi:hypothetical protein